MGILIATIPKHQESRWLLVKIPIRVMRGYYQYVEDVLSGKIVAGENIKLAC